MKLTIYIVDDEPMAVRYLEMLLKGTNLDLEVIGTAPNGVKAIPEIAKLHPDFVFVDISMPVMDGLQMSEEVLKQNPAQKIFMLTAYRDFEYAKKSVRIGVADYILKNELSEQSLEELIRENAEDLEVERRHRHTVLETNLRNFFLSDVSSETGKEWIYQDKALQRYVLLYIAPKPEIILRHEEKKYHESVDSYAVENSITIKGITCRAFIEVFRNEYCGVFFAQQDSGNIVEKCKKAAQEILEQFGHDMTDYICIVSSPVSRFSTLQMLYGRLRRKIDFLYVGTKQIYLEDELSQDKISESRRNQDNWITRWRKDLINGKQDEANELLKKQLKDFRECLDVWEYAEKIREICRNIESTLREKKYDPCVLNMKPVYTNVELLEKDLCSSQQRYSDEYKKRLGNRYSRYTILALEYIRDHYSQDISVADIAEAAGISEGHLRRCFKKEMNANIVNYLTEFRLDSAKELMKDSRESIDEIWKKTGFTSGQYFSYVFKKKEGITPRDYMRMVNDVEKGQKNV